MKVIGLMINQKEMENIDNYEEGGYYIGQLKNGIRMEKELNIIQMVI